MSTPCTTDSLLIFFCFRHDMSLDIARSHGFQYDEQNEFIFNETLIAIEDKLLAITGKGLIDYGLPPSTRGELRKSHEWIRETSFVVSKLEETLKGVSSLNPEQKYVYNEFCNALEFGLGGFWFINAPGGTGKTFLINIFLAKVRFAKGIAVAVASSGIAATMLAGGGTAHSRFKIPLDLKDDKPTCNLSPNSAMAEVLREASLIIWDECTMSPAKAYEAVDRMLRDIVDGDRKNEIMGGKLVIMTGDFRQTLPVVPRGTRVDELQASIKASPLWKEVRQYQLTTNVRAEQTGDPDAKTWADLLLQIGEGRLTQTGIVKVPDEVYVADRNALMDQIFPDLHLNFERENWLSKRAILAPKNCLVDEINETLLKKIPGQEREYKSLDLPIKGPDSIRYPTEVLNSMNFPGIPAHKLILKKGAPIILMRNLNPPMLVNGTRLQILNLGNSKLEAKILVGEYAGQVVYIPKIPLIPKDCGIQFKRVQFPVKLSFSMSINKAQGQTLKKVGLLLEEPCFSHGQFYVGCSRVGTDKNLKIVCPNQRTKNVVYKEALGELNIS